MASGEMSREQFTAFLATAFRNMADHACDGSIHFLCMDWRHMGEMLEAGEAVYGAPKNLIVWAKDNGGMGSFHRSRHELVFAFKKGTAPHVNSFELGQHGRYRTNVWEYRGVNTRRAGRLEELALHPTCKPVGMVADAIKDVSARGDIVLDLFGGSGSTLIAAHKTGRRARLVEIDPVYCDRILARWEAYAHDEAVRVERQGESDGGGSGADSTGGSGASGSRDNYSVGSDRKEGAANASQVGWVEQAEGVERPGGRAPCLRAPRAAHKRRASPNAPAATSAPAAPAAEPAEVDLSARTSRRARTGRLATGNTSATAATLDAPAAEEAQ